MPVACEFMSTAGCVKAHLNCKDRTAFPSRKKNFGKALKPQKDLLSSRDLHDPSLITSRNLMPQTTLKGYTKEPKLENMFHPDTGKWNFNETAMR